MNKQLAEIRTRLAAHGQSHVLKFFDQLGGQRQAALLEQLRQLDLDQVDGWIRDYVRGNPEPTLPADIDAAPCYARNGEGYDAAKYRDQGVELIRAGKLAASLSIRIHCFQ